MSDSIQPAKCHSRHEALEFAGGVAAGLLPARATGDDLRATMADPAKRRQIATALEEIMFPVRLPVAVVDVGGGRTAALTLLADAVFEPHVPLSG